MSVKLGKLGYITVFLNINSLAQEMIREMAIGGSLVDNRVGLAYDREVLASVPATYKLKPREPFYY